MTLKTLAYLARVSEDYCDEKLALWYNEKWEDANNEHRILSSANAKSLWIESLNDTKEQEDSLREEMDREFVRQSRKNYCAEQSCVEFARIEELKELRKLNPSFFPFGKELENCERKYKSLYLEYTSLKGAVERDGTIDDEVIRICREVKIDSLLPISEHGGASGRKNYLCPFPGHKDSEPSFIVYEDNSFHCFGCGAHGYGAIDFIMKQKEMTFIQAINFLKN